MNNEQALIDAYLDLMKKVLTASIYEESGWELVGSQNVELNPFRNSLTFARHHFKTLLAKALKKKSFALVRRKPLNMSIREAGRDWPFFAYSMAGHRRLENVRMCVEDVLRNDVPGDLIETGAWRGGTTIFMRALLKVYGVTDRKIWVADSFEGLPVPKNESDGWDLSQVDYLKVSLDQVRSNFQRFDLLDEQVEFLKGWFCDSLPKAPIENLAILRLDGDMYSSTMDALQNLYHKVSKGGYVIVDDYYSWPSCRNAVTDFLAERSIECEIKAIDGDGAYWKSI
jgi:O-methyltransferase